MPKESGFLSRIYNDIADPGSFSSPETLYRRAKQLDKTFTGTLADVRQFLESEDPYTLHRKVNKRFQRRKTISNAIDHQWQTDLIVLPSLAKENKNFRYILTCIDVLSRFAFAVPVKTKSGTDVATGFRVIFKHRIPRKIQSDMGVEFYNKTVKALFKKHKIIHFSTMSDVKCALVERFQRTLMTKLHKYFTAHNTLTYLDVLDKLIDSYNRRPHGSTG